MNWKECSNPVRCSLEWAVPCSPCQRGPLQASALPLASPESGGTELGLKTTNSSVSPERDTHRGGATERERLWKGEVRGVAPAGQEWDAKCELMVFREINSTNSSCALQQGSQPVPCRGFHTHGVSPHFESLQQASTCFVGILCVRSTQRRSLFEMEESQTGSFTSLTKFGKVWFHALFICCHKPFISWAIFCCYSS